MTRDEARPWPRRLGAKASGSGVENDGLCGRWSRRGLELADARKHGVAVLTEDEWLKMVGG